VKKGSSSVFINGLEACRVGDIVSEGPIDDPIVEGCPTVFIGDEPWSAVRPSTMKEYNAVWKHRVEKSAKFWQGFQLAKDTCAPMSVFSLLWETTGIDDPLVAARRTHELTDEYVDNFISKKETAEKNAKDKNRFAELPRKEKVLMVMATFSGGYKYCNGSAFTENIMTIFGFPSHPENATLASIADAMDSGKGVIVGYDTAPTWRDTTSHKVMAHAVRVTGVERDDNGNVTTVYINDSGGSSGGTPVSATTFQQGLDNDSGSAMYVTNDPVTTPVAKP
jgi:hypothetical protein